MGESRWDLVDFRLGSDNTTRDLTSFELLPVQGLFQGPSDPPKGPRCDQPLRTKPTADAELAGSGIVDLCVWQSP